MIFKSIDLPIRSSGSLGSNSSGHTSASPVSSVGTTPHVRDPQEAAIFVFMILQLLTLSNRNPSDFRYR